MNYKEELKKLKAEHGVVYTITAPLNDEETKHATIILKKPRRVNHAMIGKLAMGNDPVKAVEAALTALYIGGDKLELVLDNEEALMSCETAIVEIFKKKEASLKKN